MKLVSENSEADVERAYALQRLQSEMVETATNLLRVVRGAGRPYELPRQFVAVLEWLEQYRQVAGCYPSDHELSSALKYRSRRDTHQDDWSVAIDQIVQGSLQFAASTLVGQSTQQSAGETEMLDGISQIEKIRARNRIASHPRPTYSSKAAKEAARDMDDQASRLRISRHRKKKPPQLD